MCARCTHPIAQRRDRVEVDGKHAHTRVNPAGVVFTFGCFTRAEGCCVWGTPTSEDAWFSGCAWQYASCRQCGAHLGWFFSDTSTFFGLVLDRLSEPS